MLAPGPVAVVNAQQQIGEVRDNPPRCGSLSEADLFRGVSKGSREWAPAPWPSSFAARLLP